MINKVIITGRITKDIELRQTNEGTVFTYFTVAVNRQTSNKESNADFISCVAWRHNAEFLKNYFSKGSLIGIEGKLEVFTTQKDGQFNTRVNVNVQQIHFLESKKDSLQNNDIKSKNNDNKNITFDNSNEEEVDLENIDFDKIEF